MRRSVCTFIFSVMTIAAAAAQTTTPRAAPSAPAPAAGTPVATAAPVAVPASVPSQRGQAGPVKPPPAAPVATPATTPAAATAAPVRRPQATTAAPATAPQGRIAASGSKNDYYLRLDAASWQNVLLDVTITDSITADSQSKKKVGMLVLNGRSGQVRSSGGNGVINVDAIPDVRPDGRIYLQLTLEYQPELSAQQASQNGGARVTMFNESLSLIVVDGKSIIASQSSDPRSDRKVTVEVLATVVK